MKKTGLDVSDLITLVRRKGGDNIGVPYKSFVCRCSNCLYSAKGKCALKECCCMDERIRAHTCTFGEMMRYCFSGIGDNVFRMICYAVAISAYGLDAIKVSEKQIAKKYKQKRKGERINE